VVVVSNTIVGPAEGQATLGDVTHSHNLSSIRSWKFGGNGEYNGHAHRKEHKESSFGGCCYCSSLGVCYYWPLGGSGSPDSGSPQ
jgi:hypothetical protein